MGYPRWIYKKNCSPRLVQNAEEHSKLKGWKDQPQDIEWQREFRKGKIKDVNS